MSNSCTGYSSLVVLVNLGHLIMVVVEKTDFPDSFNVQMEWSYMYLYTSSGPHRKY